MPPPKEIECGAERLYVVFARYPRQEHMEVCPCCRGPESVRPLYGRPLRELRAEDLHFYAFCAMTTMGDVDDFRHFLPRILELLKDQKFLASVAPEVVLGKLRYGNWDTWAEEEQSAVREYLQCLWRLMLRIPPPDSPYEYPPIGDWLCAFGRAEHDMVPYLEAWRADTSAAAKANLTRFVSAYKEELSSRRSPAGYWEDAAPQWQQIAQWASASRLLD